MIQKIFGPNQAPADQTPLNLLTIHIVDQLYLACVDKQIIGRKH